MRKERDGRDNAEPCRVKEEVVPAISPESLLQTPSL